MKQLIFWIYVAFEKIRWRLREDKKDDAPVFIWKDSWFFMWHWFFWNSNRQLLSHFVNVRPLEHELGSDAEEHYRRFNEFASRDSTARSMDQRIIRPTHFPLSPEAAKELCLLYACIVDVAPWQYGTEHRLRVLRRVRTVFFFSLLAFAASVSFYAPGSYLFAWAILFSFLGALISLAGWRASSSLYKIAREAERLRSEETKES